MRESYKVAYEEGHGELVEKKSRFIATVRPVESEEEALAFIEEMRKKYWDARHNCFAYVIGDRMQLQRFGDDGEPQGTAGKPMLDVLLGEAVHNVAVVVTRYFGGTLLGTGGLVRAYSHSTKEGLHNSVIIEKCPGKTLQIRTDYNGIGKILYLLGQKEIPVQKSDYAADVTLEVIVPLQDVEQLIEEITQATSGKAETRTGQDCYFARHHKELLVFDN